MNRFDRWVLKVKRRETPAARLAHDAYHRLLDLRLPETDNSRRVFRMAYVAHDILVDSREWAAGKLLYEPMLRGRAFTCGPGLRITALPYIRGHVRIRIGANCTFGLFSVSSGRFIDKPQLIFGDGCTVGTDVLFNVNKRIMIGNHVGISGRVTIQDSDGHPSDPERRMRGEQITEADIGPVTIGDYAWIGRDAQVLKGVTIGKGAVVAAGSIVATDVPDGALAMGCPARVVRR